MKNISDSCFCVSVESYIGQPEPIASPSRRFYLLEIVTGAALEIVTGAALEIVTGAALELH